MKFDELPICIFVISVILEEKSNASSLGHIPNGGTNDGVRYNPDPSKYIVCASSKHK